MLSVLRRVERSMADVVAVPGTVRSSVIAGAALLVGHCTTAWGGVIMIVAGLLCYCTVGLP